jgi:hypothetical protein
MNNYWDLDYLWSKWDYWPLQHICSKQLVFDWDCPQDTDDNKKRRLIIDKQTNDQAPLVI